MGKHSYPVYLRALSPSVLLLVGINLLQHLAGRLGLASAFLVPPTLPLKELSAIFAACLLATCFGPYSFHLYQVIFEYSKAKLPYLMIRELQPLNFRFSAHYVQLLLAAAGFFAVGYQKKIDPFKLALLTIASIVAFRTMRDSWFICISAAACIADFPAEPASRDRAETPLEIAGVAATVLVLLLLFARNTDFNTRGLDAVVSSQFPVGAANFLRQNRLSGPLYNDLDWGGFLTGTCRMIQSPSTDTTTSTETSWTPDSSTQKMASPTPVILI